MDMEILQDFLPEATELLENAASEALTLEKNPDDDNAIAALFRAFHTLKGGAGFLEATAMVEWCHHLEDLLDKVRNKSLRITPEMVDVILKGIDVIHDMLGALQQGDYPSSGPDDLSLVIRNMAKGLPSTGLQPTTRNDAPIGAAIMEQTSTPTTTTGATPVRPHTEGILHVELRSREDGSKGLYLQHGGTATVTATVSSCPVETGEDVISEDEFEKYLDQLYGEGKIPGDLPVTPSKSEVQAAPSDVCPGTTSSQVATPPPVQPAAAKKPGGMESHTEVAESTLRVEASRLDAVMNQVGELVLLRNRFAAAVQALTQENEDMSRIAREMDLTVNDMQGTVMRLRMQPCKRLFQQLPRVVRDTSRQIGKNVKLLIEGEEVEIDKTVVDALSAPLVHLVRNSLDHGIELPADRKMLGKPETATLRVAAIHLGDKVRIEVSDDGQGIDRQLVTRKAVEKGLISADEAARLSEQEAVELIFMPGFSTNDQVTEISGRGVGMDVVKETTHQLRGRLDVRTEIGRGTTVAMEFPLTLAVLPVLYLRLRREIYALPISAVESLLEVEAARVHQIQGRSLYRVGGEQIVPMIDLGAALYNKPLRLGSEPTDGILTERGLLIVSEVLGNEDSVVKPMDFMPEGNWYQGATISGKGDVVLILDVGAVLRSGLAQQQKEVA
jgi:two-component system chemotaxis sensor kinase CheA